MPVRIRRFPAQTKSPTTVTPRLTSTEFPIGFGGVPFRLLSPAYPRVTPKASTSHPGREGFRRTFQRGRPRFHFQPGTYFFKAQPRFYRQARLNSRNRLIITTPLHIVNHSPAHL